MYTTPTHLKLTPAEQQSGSSRQRWAEGLIEQLPGNHDGRNGWLLNFGVGGEAERLRQERGLWFDPEFMAVGPTHIHVAGEGKTLSEIDRCAKCGHDIRHAIHTRLAR